jgi:hypothetical protein
MLNVNLYCNAESHNSECHYAKSHNGEWHYDGSHCIVLNMTTLIIKCCYAGCHVC